MSTFPISTAATRVALVSCVKTKRTVASHAEELYTSTLFIKMRRFALRNADTWYILSAKYGLLRPDETVEPYELTLTTMRKAGRIAWSTRVKEQLSAALPNNAEVLFLAGEAYRDELVPFLEQRKIPIKVPMAGMRMGAQLRWLNEQGCDR